jgi:hypothetical protein
MALIFIIKLKNKRKENTFKVRQMQNVSENFILLFFYDFRILRYRFGGLAKGILFQKPVFYFLFEFEVG